MIPDYVVGRKVYVASSWRNTQHDNVVSALRAANHLVYNYREDTEDLDTAWRGCVSNSGGGVDVYLLSSMLSVKEAHNKFIHHQAALDWCDTLVLLLPSGNDAHIELGYAAGRGCHVVIQSLEPLRPGLMYKFAHSLVATTDELLDILAVPLPEGVE